MQKGGEHMDHFEVRTQRRKKARLGFLLALPVVIALIIGAGIYVFTYHVNEFQLDLTVNGEENVVLEYGQRYEDPGADARFFGSHILPEGIEVAVVQTGSVDVNRVGTYTLTYQAQYERWFQDRKSVV